VKRRVEARYLCAAVCYLLVFGLAETGCLRQTTAPRSVVTQPSPSRAARHALPSPPRRTVAKPLSSVAPVAATSRPQAPQLGPAIYSVSASPNVARAGDTIVWNVRTSADVTTVSANATGFTIPLQRQGPGRFGTTFEIPSIVPPFFRGTYAVRIVARNAAGVTTTSHLSMHLQ